MKMVGRIPLAAAMLAAALLLVVVSGPVGSELTEAASPGWTIGSNNNLMLTAPGTVWLRAVSYHGTMNTKKFGWASGTGAGTWDVSPLVDCKAAPTGWQSLGPLGAGELDFGIRTWDANQPPSGPHKGHTIVYVTGGTGVPWDRHSDVDLTQQVDLGVRHNNYDISGQCVTMSWEDQLGGGDQDFNDCVVELCVGDVDKVVAALWLNMAIPATPELPQWFDEEGWPPNTIPPYPTTAPRPSYAWPPIPMVTYVGFGASIPAQMQTDELDWSSDPVDVIKTATLEGVAKDDLPGCWVSTDLIAPVGPGPVTQTVYESEPAGWSNLTTPLQWEIQIVGSACWAQYCVKKEPVVDPIHPVVVFIQPAESCFPIYDPILMCRDSDTLNCPGTPPCPDGVADPEASAAEPRCGPPDNSPDTYNPRQERPVGGIAELPVDASDAPAALGERSGRSWPPYAAIAGGLGGALLALTAGGWYARRRWLS